MQKNSLNKVILIGNLGQDPEARFTPQGTAVTNLSIATNESWKDQSGEMQDRTEWHRVVMYGRMAETATEYMKKGQMVYVEGRLHTREWEDQNQIKRKTTELDVITLQCWVEDLMPRQVNLKAACHHLHQTQVLKQMTTFRSSRYISIKRQFKWRMLGFQNL